MSGTLIGLFIGFIGKIDGLINVLVAEQDVEAITVTSPSRL